MIQIRQTDLTEIWQSGLILGVDSKPEAIF